MQEIHMKQTLIQQTEWDVTKVNAEDIPQSEIWTFGFPCKNFSTANAVSRYGLRGEQSGLFMNMIGLLHEVKEKPRYLFIENVKGFTTLNGGVDFLYALTLIHKLNYDIKYEISSAIEYNVPQNRIRTYLVCELNANQDNKKGLDIPTNKNVDINGINIYELNELVQQQNKKVKISWGKRGVVSNGICTVESYQSYPVNLTKHLSSYLEKEVDDKLYLTDEQLEKVKYMKGSKEKLLPDGRIWKEGAVPFPDSIDRYARCVTPSDGSLNRSTHLIKGDKGYRKLTIRERARLQHLDDSFVFPVSDSQASLQLGNGVCVKVIKEITERWIKK